MMLEIGSEFWTGCTPLDGGGVTSLLPAGMDVRYTLCGRTALELVLRDVLQRRPIHRAYLPSYCCHTMIEPFAAKGIKVEFYDVFFTEAEIDFCFQADNQCDLVFLMDYFGFLTSKTMSVAAEQKSRGKCVVYDATHSMFCKGMDYRFCDYVFGSFRKWFGVNAGFCAKAGAWNDFSVLTQNIWYTDRRNTAFERKRAFMAGEPVEKAQFLQVFADAEERLETDYLGYGPDSESVRILKTVNVDFIRRKRRENAAFAISAISDMQYKYVVSPYKTVGERECPLFVPLQVDPSVRTALRGKLIDNQVYLPIHWPLSILHETGSHARMIYDSELSFVCDQRYAGVDMERAAEIIRSFGYNGRSLF